MSTPHNAAQQGDIAKVVLMPGDPLRAQVIAERYLENVTCFNKVRNMLGFTGTYHGKPVSVMGSGMGIPSISIYSYELYHEYDVDTIIRIGSAGGLSSKVAMRDIVFAQGACSDSNAFAHYKLPGTYAPIADFDLLRAGVEEAERLGASYHVGNVVSTDIFYSNQSEDEAWTNMGVLAVEMEAAGLYLVAAQARKRALALMTISDHLFTGESLPAEERQTSFTQMMEIALAVAEREYAKKSARAE